MNLVKWLRKNNRKIMAVVVVFIMISFVLGAALQQLSRNVGFTDNAIWQFGDDESIKRADLSIAEKQLDVISALGIGDNILLARDPNTGQIGQRNLSPILLYQLMYPTSTDSSQLSQIAKLFIRQNQLGIPESQVDKFFSQSRENQNLNWILITEEAKRAGITVMTTQIKDMLSSAGMENRLSSMSANLNITKDDIYRAVANFFEVRAYLTILTAGDDTTTNQLRSVFKGQMENFDANFVSINAEMFTKNVAEPAESKILEFFEQYKSLPEGLVSPENPFGFGYKLPNMASLEYIILENQEVEKLVGTVTDAEVEQFYQDNSAMFVENVRKNPSDPNSEVIQQAIAYPKIASRLKQQIRQNKLNAKADEIMSNLKDSADAGFTGIDPDKITSEALKAASADYNEIAKLAETKFNIKLDCGKTSLLSAQQFVNISAFGNFALTTNQKTPIPLAKLVFSADGFDTNFLPFDAQKPKLYENIGMLINRYGGKYAIARVLEISKAQVPSSLDTMIEIKTPLSEYATDANSYTIRKKVIDDIKLQEAMTLAVKAADEFIKAAGNSVDWTALIEQFNAKYPVDKKDEKTFKMDSWTKQRKILASDIENAKAMSQSQPGAEAVVSQSLAMQSMIAQLHTHFEKDSSVAGDVPFAVEFKPQGQVVIIKSMTRQQPNEAEYQKAKPELALGLDARTAQGAAFAVLMPENLKHRLNLSLVETKDETNDANDANKVK